MPAQVKEKILRRIIDWELRLNQHWWLNESGEDPAIARRWAAIILTIAVYACWRRAVCKRGAAGLGWIVSNQKVRDSPFTQFLYREGPPRAAMDAVATLQGGSLASAVMDAVTTLQGKKATLQGGSLG